MHGADPAGGGQFWLLLAGSLELADHPVLPEQSCVLVSPETAAPDGIAGESGAELLCLQFPMSH